MNRAPDGRYVDYAEVEGVEAENAQLRAEIERLKAELTLSQNETHSATHAYQLLAEAYESKPAEFTQLKVELAQAQL